ncbi:MULTISPECIES: CYTH domain-containing protein [Tenacibaculum]|uniref:CYTH domain-containing protein n=1 Tax=Tenacibaculum TaxID=104267 RepID=UPI00089848F3|nr:MULTISPECIES: CYTH domain-containing protein [unclassified Tenacibaculum]RBW59760.1 CYTH domain-containing protein [Tenacibaculum sp. E3R01]SED92322.1 CYTH domain-containing protein [Tenacibaculum sp. MAR_2010_89]
MVLEIERKFLVASDDYKFIARKKNYIKQGFLNSDKHRVVRVRIKDDLGFLTIKGPSNKSGTTRFEWEKEITKSEAENLLSLCEEGIIEKYRFLVDIDAHTYEIDEFLGDNLGLIVAEIELKSEDENFKKPNWLGKEVTGIVKYYNSNISKLPFNKW